MQTTYTADKARLIPGAIATGDLYGGKNHTRVNAQIGQAKVFDIVFAGVWAAADTQTTTLGGVPVVSTMQAGEDTVTEARDRVRTTLLGNANITRDYEVTAVSTDTLRITGKPRTPGGSDFVDYSAASIETTAGSGTATGTVTTAYAAEGALPFGVGVALDPTDPRGKRVTLPATGFRFGGVVVFSHAFENRDLPSTAGVPARTPFSARMEGPIGVQVEEDVQAGDPAFLRHTANANGTPGGWRNDADSATCDAVAGRFITGASAGGVAVLELNAP
jgi:hypothetical protein